MPASIFYTPTLTHARIRELWNSSLEAEKDPVLTHSRFALAIEEEVRASLLPENSVRYMKRLAESTFKAPLDYVRSASDEVYVADANSFILFRLNEPSPAGLSPDEKLASSQKADEAVELAKFVVCAMNDYVAFANGTPPTDTLERVVSALSAMVRENAATEEGTISLDTFKKATEALALAKYSVPPSIPDYGMSVSQEPKYGIRNGFLFNRASGTPIPQDEPVFIFRARDNMAVGALQAYEQLLPPNSLHSKAVLARIDQFVKFSQTHPARMKDPDTAISRQSDLSPSIDGPKEIF